MLNNFNNKVDVISALNALNIKHQNTPNSKGWLSIICPLHNDSNFGNASINIYSGVISCFKCGASKNISSLLKDSSSVYSFIPSDIPEPIKQEVKKSTNITKELNYNFIHKVIDNPEDFYYLKQRKFTKEFCEHFNIVRSFTDPYTDYFAFPIQDSEKNLFQVEFRKLMQFEYLQKYYNSFDIPHNILTDKFKTFCENNRIKITDYKLYKNGMIIEDKVLFYLLDKKVKYETGSRIKETIWNIDNLDYNKPLWLVEGIGSIPSIYENISKNCTCTFGSQVSNHQLDYLRRFKQIYLVADNDEAGAKMVFHLHNELKNLIVVYVQSEDTDENYIFDISNTNNHYTANEYLAKVIMKYNKTLF
jgi:5S rRNA maturation endonuclease (ribonuclease M5)